MSVVVVRKATDADAQIIALLARVTFRETFGTNFKDPQDLLDYFNSTFSVQKLRSSINRDNNVFWIALYDDLPVGYAKLKKHSPSAFISDSQKVSQLQKIYVLKDFLAMKIGQNLQNELLAECKLIGTEYVWLSVLKANERAIRFYEKHEFTAVGEVTFDIGKEHFEFHAMKKVIV